MLNREPALLSIGAGKVRLNPGDRADLIEALFDERPEVVVGAPRVLATLISDDAVANVLIIDN